MESTVFSDYKTPKVPEGRCRERDRMNGKDIINNKEKSDVWYILRNSFSNNPIYTCAFEASSLNKATNFGWINLPFGAADT